MTTRSGVYQIKNIANGHRYIGSSIDVARRIRGHQNRLHKNNHPNFHLQNAYRKYGEGEFVCSLLLYCDPENALLYEQMCIDGLKPEYNIAIDVAAPMMGRKHPESTKLKMSASRIGNQNMLGYHPTEETRRKQSEALKGRAFSDEHRKHLGDAQRGVPKSEKNKQALSESIKAKHKHPSIETRVKLSNALVGNKRAAGNHSRGMLGLRHTEETKQKMSASHKKLVANKRGEE